MGTLLSTLQESNENCKEQEYTKSNQLKTTIDASLSAIETDPIIPITNVTRIPVGNTFTDPQVLYAGSFVAPLYINNGADAGEWTCPNADALVNVWGGSEQVRVGDIFGVPVINKGTVDQTFIPGTGGIGGSTIAAYVNKSTPMYQQTLWFRITSTTSGSESYTLF